MVKSSDIEIEEIFLKPYYIACSIFCMIAALNNLDKNPEHKKAEFS